jgi:hypothetical protein
VEQAQNFSTPAKAAGFKLESYDYEEAGGATFSPFLRELDLAMRQAWREESVLPEEILDHLEKLREAMDKVLESVHKNHLESLEHYQEIAGDQRCNQNVGHQHGRVEKGCRTRFSRHGAYLGKAG